MKQTDKNFFDAIPQIGTKELNNLAKEMFSGKTKQHTAVEWLESNLPTAFKDLTINKQLIEQAKEIEKQQIIMPINPKISTKVIHSKTKPAFNIVCLNLGQKYKIARIPYFINENFSEEWNNKQIDEAKNHAEFISYCFNKNY